MRKSLVIIGAGGLGREIVWLVNDINRVTPEWDLLGFVDDGITGTTVEGYPILGSVSSLYDMDWSPWVVVAIAYGHARMNITGNIINAGIQVATLIHPTVQHSNFVRIEPGTIICAGSVITTNISLGKACIVNPNCFVGHDSILEDYVSLMPASNIAGEVHVGTGCYFGMNSCVINRRIIGEWSIIGAGATVIDDIPPYSLAVGVPAKVIRKLHNGV